MASGIEELEAEGWTRRFVASEPRLSESVAIYEEAGFDVHLEPLPKEPTCESCAEEGEQDDSVTNTNDSPVIQKVEADFSRRSCCHTRNAYRSRK